MNKAEKLTKYIEDKAKSIKMGERAKSKLATLLIDYELDFLKECVDISFSKYIIYDCDNNIKLSSFKNFFNKIGGIAYNRSLSPIDKEIAHILNIGSKSFSDWDSANANTILKQYITELKKTLGPTK